MGIQRNTEKNFGIDYNISQTMIRVKDAKKTLSFYQNAFGLQMIGEKHFDEHKFSLYFLANQEATQDVNNNNDFFVLMKDLFHPVLEITHNHGTEDDDSFSYHNGNSDPVGFSNLTFLVDNINSTKDHLNEVNVEFEELNDFSVLIKDPDNYHIEVVEKI